MKIFIDESGAFIPSPDKPQGVSVVGALTIPTCKYEKVCKWFAEISDKWPRDKGEIKGRRLNERHIGQIIPFLKRCDVIYQAVAMDVNPITNDDATNHRMTQARMLPMTLTPTHHPNVHQSVNDMAAALKKIGNQLYLQSLAMNSLVSDVIRYSTLYYCQRKPSELGSFDWVIDAKQPNKKTEYEDLWYKLVMPVLQTESLFGEPHFRLIGGDYRYFERHFLHEDMPEFIFEHLPPDRRNNYEDKKRQGLDVRPTDIGNIMRRSCNFDVSQNHCGLILADILTNAIRRAFMGNLGSEGWLPIGELMIPKKGKSIHLITISDRGERAMPDTIRQVVIQTGRNGRSLIKKMK